MKQKDSITIKKSSILYWMKVATLGIVLGVGLQFAQAWTEPAEAPPGGNVPGPLTTGSDTQFRVGNLAVNTGDTANGINPKKIGFAVLHGKVGIGTATPSQSLEVNGKIVSASTQSSDPGNTVVTKDYLDARLDEIGDGEDGDPGDTGPPGETPQLVWTLINSNVYEGCFTTDRSEGTRLGWNDPCYNPGEISYYNNCTPAAGGCRAETAEGSYTGRAYACYSRTHKCLYK